MQHLLKYIDVCSGVSAPTLAWRGLGWQALVYSDIEGAPRQLLRQRYADVPLHGRDRRKGEKLEDYARDAGFQTIEGNEYGAADLLVGGTPCQSFSVAGLRKGMGDERGNLALEYIRLARRARTRWVVWENVPGVLTSSRGEDLRCFLAGLAGWDVPIPAGGWKNSGIIQSAPGDLNWGLAWRILDAQHFGVPQRRRRIILVGYLGDWRRAAAALFERESLQGNPPPSREATGKVAPTLPSRSTAGGGLGTDFDCEGSVVVRTFDRQSTGQYGEAPVASTVAARDYKSASDLIAHTLRGEGFDASEDGTGRGTPLVAVPSVFAIQERASCENPDAGPDGKGFRDDGVAYTLEARTVPQAVAFSSKDHGGDAGEISPTLRSGSHSASHANAGAPPAVATGTAVRRLTPRECERLQGFPDDWTRVPVRTYRSRPKVRHFERFPDLYDEQPDGSWIRHMADGPRYKLCGNSMAVPVMRWVGRRIAMVEALGAELEQAA